MTHAHRIRPHLIAALGFLCVLLASATASAECDPNLSYWDYAHCMSVELNEADATIAILEAEANTVAGLVSACTGQNTTVQTDTTRTHHPSCTFITLNTLLECVGAKLDEANAIVASLEDEVNDLAAQHDACVEEITAAETTTTECTVSDAPFFDIMDMITAYHQLEGCLEAETQANGGSSPTQCVLAESYDMQGMMNALHEFSACQKQEALEAQAEQMHATNDVLSDAAENN